MFALKPTSPVSAFTGRLAYTRASKFKGQNTRVVLKSLHSTDITDVESYARVGGIGRGALPTIRQTRKTERL